MNSEIDPVIVNQLQDPLQQDELPTYELYTGPMSYERIAVNPISSKYTSICVNEIRRRSDFLEVCEYLDYPMYQNDDIDRDREAERVSDQAWSREYSFSNETSFGCSVLRITGVDEPCIVSETSDEIPKEAAEYNKKLREKHLIEMERYRTELAELSEIDKEQGKINLEINEVSTNSIDSLVLEEIERLFRLSDSRLFRLKIKAKTYSGLLINYLKKY